MTAIEQIRAELDDAVVRSPSGNFGTVVDALVDVAEAAYGLRTASKVRPHITAILAALDRLNDLLPQHYAREGE